MPLHSNAPGRRHAANNSVSIPHPAAEEVFHRHASREVRRRHLAVADDPQHHDPPQLVLGQWEICSAPDVGFYARALLTRRA